MNPEIHWLLHFCSEHELLNKGQIKAVCANPDAMGSVRKCADMLQRTGWVTDHAFLEGSIEAAVQNVRDGFPPPTVEGIPRNLGRTSPMVEHEGLPDFASLSDLDDVHLKAEMEHLLLFCQQSGASDLHLTAGARPRMRLHRKLVYLSSDPLVPELARRLNLILLDDAQIERFEREWDLDFVIHLASEEANPDIRMRSNLSVETHGVSGVYHILSGELIGLESIGFPEAGTIRKLLTYHNGILIIAGPVGSGKTTTLACLIDELNRTRKDHIVAIEQPIERVQHSKDCIVTQREVGKHTENFHSALKSSLREDPDIIVVGEMHDLETIEMAITAAETGHLVIATMHTSNAAATLSRLLDVFPPSQLNQIRSMLSGSLRGVICQRLLPNASNDGVVMVSELLVNNGAVAHIIREGKETGIENAIQTGKRFGMWTMNESVERMRKQGAITGEVARRNFQQVEDPNI